MKKICFVVAALLFVFAPVGAWAQQEVEVVTGTLNVIWKDPITDPDGKPGVLYKVLDSRGERHNLFPVADIHGQMHGLKGMRVAAYGARDVARREFRANKVFALEATNGAIKDSLSVAWLMCQFGDDPGMPHSSEHYAKLIGVEYPGVSHFWERVSNGRVSFEGSVVRGPFRIGARASYTSSSDSQGDFGRIAEDCARAADREVYFRDFDGIGLFLSNELDGNSYGGVISLNVDGAIRTYGVAWIPASGAQQFVVAHELGHALFGFGHSVDATGKVNSWWDVMSWGFFSFPDGQPWSEFGAIGVGPIAFHKLRSGWIPSAQKYIPKAGSVQTIRMEHLASNSGSGYLVAQIPVSNIVSYTVEVRRQKDGYDRGVPGDAVVIHKIDGNSEPMVVDPDGNDLSAMWLQGETFIITENKVRISVESADADGSMIMINASDTIPTVRVISPKEGDKWKVGSFKSIMWSETKTVRIEVSRDGGVSWQYVGEGRPSGLSEHGIYRWRVSEPPSEHAMIRVSSGIDAAVSAQFRIIPKKRRQGR